VSEIDLKRFPLLSDLTDSDREAVAELLEPIELAPGRQCFREGQEAEGLLLIDRGELRLESERGGELGTSGEGTAIGGLSLLVVGPRELTAIAVAPTRVLQLSRSSFLRLAEDYPRTGLRLAQAIMAEFAGAVREGLDRFAPPAG
jgi:CRP-like cAMP-binding protein